MVLHVILIQLCGHDKHDINIFIKWHVGKICGRLFKIPWRLELRFWQTRKWSQPSQCGFFAQIALQSESCNFEPSIETGWIGVRKSHLYRFIITRLKINGTKKTVSSVQPTEVRLYTPSLPQTYLLVFLTYHFCCWFFKLCSVNLHIEVLSGSTVSTKINSICINRKFLDNSISKYRHIKTFCTMPINAYHISWAIIITKLYTDVDEILICLITRSYL